VDLGGTQAWCGAELPDYAAATSGARAAAKAVSPEALDVIAGARWRRDLGSIVIVGPTGFGKSRVLIAIGLRILDRALRGVSADDLRFAAGLRMVNGLALALAPSQHRLGDGEPPLLATAKGATLLLLDEIGFETHLEVIRDVIFHRYDRGAPTIVASGRTAEELEGRYGNFCHGHRR
jgi:DNA replication protein DnaC